MTLREAKIYASRFKHNNPEFLIEMAVDYEFSDKRLMESMEMAEIVWLSGNYSEDTAFEMTLKHIINEEKKCQSTM